MHGDQRLLSQAVANLLDNALRHTPAGTLVRLVGETGGRTASITVRDDGPVAAVADLSTLLRRFVRVD
ncbi:ATP-binding protein, partial [Clostridium perfringens]